MQDLQLLNSLLAVTAYLMAANTSIKDKSIELGHRASQRAIQELRTRLDAKVDVVASNALQTMLHLARGAFYCGELSIAFVHLRAFLGFEPMLRNGTLWERCIRRIAFAYDVYLAAETGKCPMMNWVISDDNDHYPEPECSPPSLRQDPQESTSRTVAVRTKRQTSTLVVPNVKATDSTTQIRAPSAGLTQQLYQHSLHKAGYGFSEALVEGVLSPSLGLVVKLYLSLTEFSDRWSGAEYITPEAFEWSHMRTLRTMHELCKAFHNVQSLQHPTNSSPRHPRQALAAASGLEKRFLDQEAIVALQLHLITPQGPWLHRTANALVRRLRRCMELRILALNSQPRSPKDSTGVFDRRKTLYKELQLWMCMVGMLAAQSIPEERTWFEDLAVSLAEALGIMDYFALKKTLCKFGVPDPDARDRIQRTGRIFAEKCL
jgi:hypothetical protein